MYAGYIPFIKSDNGTLIQCTYAINYPPVDTDVSFIDDGNIIWYLNHCFADSFKVIDGHKGRSSVFVTMERTTDKSICNISFYDFVSLVKAGKIGVGGMTAMMKWCFKKVGQSYFLTQYTS